MGIPTLSYDHCIFAALDDVDSDVLARFRSLLLAQQYSDPTVRHLLDLEGLKEWRDGRLEGFGQLNDAIDKLAFSGAETVRQFIAETANS